MEFYHISISTIFGTRNLFDLPKDDLEKVLQAYYHGKDALFVNGRRYSLDQLQNIKIFKASQLWANKGMPAQELANKGLIEKNMFAREAYLSYKGMLLFGHDVTSEILEMEYGEGKNQPLENSPQEVNKPEKLEVEFDYAIITALYKDELKFIEPYINFVGEINSDEKKLIRHGTLKVNKDVRIIYASLLNTGMVDAAIVATDIITRFQPKILLMPGVCGGRDKDELALSDIIVATKVFTFQKGKVKEDAFEPEWEGIDLNDKLIQKIQAREDEITASLEYKGKIHYEPMACSTAVIDKEGVLNEISVMKDRKTLGLEMEGYGIARACAIANNGWTKALIIKSVMDKTSEKTDDVKLESAKNSADFVMKLIELEVI